MPEEHEGDQRPLPRGPGYLECRRILSRLHRYYDLACHGHNWAGLPSPKRPLTELLPSLPMADEKGPDGSIAKPVGLHPF